MILRLGGYAALGLFLILLCFVMVVMSGASWKLSAALLPAAAIGGFFAINPFATLVMLVLFAQMDAIANMISAFLPVSFFKLMTAAAFGGYALMSLARPREQRLGPNVFELRVTMLFALAMITSLLMSEYFAAGQDHTIGFLSVMSLMWLIVVLVDSQKKFEIVVMARVLSGIVSAMITLLDTFLGIRLVSTRAAAATAQFEGIARSAGASDFNPTTAAHMMLATCVLAGVLFVRLPRFRAFTGLAFLVGVPALVMTLARSAAIAFAVGALIFAWRNRHHRMFPLAVVFMATACAAAVPFVPEVYWERMATIFDFGVDRTLFRRVSYNLIGLDLLAQHPILGVGPGNFPDYYASHEYRFYPGREPLPRQLHNSYLEVAAEMGLVGLTLFMTIMISSLRRAIEVAVRARSALSPFGEALAYSFGVFLIASAFMPNEDIKFMWILPALCIAAWRLQKSEATEDES